MMRSRTQPQDVPKGFRQRHMNRPKSFWRKGSHPAFESRPDETSVQRHSMKMCNSPGQLLKRLNKAISNRCCDYSVISAAMQPCGTSRWWDALLEIRQIQKDQLIRLSAV